MSFLFLLAAARMPVRFPIVAAEVILLFVFSAALIAKGIRALVLLRRDMREFEDFNWGVPLECAIGTLLLGIAGVVGCGFLLYGIGRGAEAILNRVWLIFLARGGSCRFLWNHPLEFHHG